MNVARASADQILITLHRVILAILVCTMVGTFVELLLIAHYEDTWQLVPLILLVGGFVALMWQFVVPRPSSFRIFEATMLLFVAAGFLGIYFHYQGSKAFQLEIDPSLSGTALLWQTMRAKAPPKLAPGLMIQLGALGLGYAFTRRPRY
jgi:hypothetical protein